jgi:signal transduction histidine kinase
MRPENWDSSRKDEKPQRLERMGALTRDFAHEFNNLLNSILMSARLLQANRPQDEQQRLLKVVQASALRGAEIVKGLLAETVH